MGWWTTYVRVDGVNEYLAKEHSWTLSARELDKIMKKNPDANPGVECRVLRSACVGSVWYAAVETTRKDGSKYGPFALVVLWRRSGGRSDPTFSCKDMEEFSGPYIASCPKTILSMLAPVEDLTSSPPSLTWAARWRASCWLNAYRKTVDRPVDAFIDKVQRMNRKVGDAWRAYCDEQYAAGGNPSYKDQEKVIKEIQDSIVKKCGGMFKGMFNWNDPEERQRAYDESEARKARLKEVEAMLAEVREGTGDGSPTPEKAIAALEAARRLCEEGQVTKGKE